MTDPKPARPADARATCTELLEISVWLAVNLLPGTAKPWSPPTMSAEKRAELDDLTRRTKLRDEAHAGMLVPLGESPAPMDLNILDLLVEVLEVAERLAHQVADESKAPRMVSTRSVFEDPKPYLRFIVANAHQAPNLATTIVVDCDALIFQARSMLGLLTDGQLLAAVCPWCAGRTPKHPVGGQKTLRVRLSSDPDPIALIVCESGLCEPPTADYGTTWRGRPAWPLEHEGAWLARQIERAAEATA